MTHRRSFLKKSAAITGLLSLNGIPALTSNMTEEPFASYQQKRRDLLMSLLGELPWDYVPKPPQLIKKEKHPGYTLEHILFDFNGLEAVPGILLIPDQIKQSGDASTLLRPQAPCMLYIHAHGGTYPLGKDELVKGRDVLPAYAPVCAEKGILTLAIDSWCFGERNHLVNDTHGESDTFKQMLWDGRSLWGMMLFDEMRALDYLLKRPEADPNRVGVFGLSMGATKAWWLAALDTRIKYCLDLCCLTDFDALIATNNLKGHGIYYYVPKLLKYFNTSTINELIVPRPHLSLNGRLDTLTPPDGVQKVKEYLLPLYKKYGNASDLRIDLFDSPHEETKEMRKIVLEWLDRLKVEG